jgi:UTP--glucose-1-phosphate uridylyltransferase
MKPAPRRRSPMEIKKVVVPVAGWGTRSLPATKNVPKEMLPIYKKPVVQYVVEEAQAAGLTDVVFVTNRNKTIIEDHFDYNLALEKILEASGKTELLETVRRTAEMANIITVRQKKQLGLGHAVLCAKEVVKNEPFAVMVGDDLMFSMEPGIKQLMEVAQSEHMPVVGVMEVPADKVSSYGIIAADEFASGLYRVRDLVEKPKPSQAPSKLAMVGRYVLFPDIFDHLEALKPNKDGEYQLTDALKGLAQKGRLIAVKIRGQRFDAGDWVDYLAANIYFALQDEELRYPLISKLRDFMPV